MLANMPAFTPTFSRRKVRDKRQHPPIFDFLLMDTVRLVDSWG